MTEMTPVYLELVRDALAWCIIMNMVVLLFWFAMMTCCRGWVYRVHTRWYNVSPSDFDAIHYKGMLMLKIGIFFFNIVPYLALRIVF